MIVAPWKLMFLKQIYLPKTEASRANMLVAFFFVKTCLQDF